MKGLLYSDTIDGNISFGDSDMPEEDVVKYAKAADALQCRQSGVLIRNGISHSWINRYWVAYCPNIEIYFLQEKKLRDLHYF